VPVWRGGAFIREVSRYFFHENLSFFSLEGKETKVQDAEKYILKIRHLYEENCKLPSSSFIYLFSLS